MSVSLDDITSAAKGSGEGATSVFVAWERLRLIYNALLVLVTLLLGWDRLREPNFARMLIVGAIIANLAFCLGMTAEGYLALIGLPRRPARLVLFVLGTLLALLWATVHVMFPRLGMID